MEREKLMRNKIKGCLIGGAIGDALGYPVEFKNYKKIIKKYGDQGIQEYDLNYLWQNGSYNDAQISDDTQMTLYTAEAILKNPDSEEEIIENIKRAYVEWMCLQTGVIPNLRIDLNIINIKELNQKRAPGNTCISALRKLNAGKDVINNSKGCGAVMRMAPIGILSKVKGLDTNQLRKLAFEVAEITHLHSLSTYSSALCAEIVRNCLSTNKCTTEDFKFIIKNSFHSLYGSETLGKNNYNQNQKILYSLIIDLCKLKEDPREDWKIIEKEFGGGWVAEEALAISLFCIIRHLNDFSACLKAAVNHSGDSDSTGAISGNIFGALIGYERIPASFLIRLQNLKYIENISERLAVLKSS